MIGYFFSKTPPKPILSRNGALWELRLFSIGTKWGQFGNGGGGVRVLPEGLAFGVWFDGGGDLNANITSTPEPSSVLLLGSGIAALAGWRRYRQS